MKIAGYNHATGTFEGRVYDNYNFVTYDKEESDNRKWQFVKVKARVLADSGIDPRSLVNKDVDFDYDRYGNVKSILMK